MILLVPLDLQNNDSRRLKHFCFFCEQSDVHFGINSGIFRPEVFYEFSPGGGGEVFKKSIVIKMLLGVKLYLHEMAWDSEA